jgi:hypothetical protein
MEYSSSHLAMRSNLRTLNSLSKFEKPLVPLLLIFTNTTSSEEQPRLNDTTLYSRPLFSHERMVWWLGDLSPFCCQLPRLFDFEYRRPIAILDEKMRECDKYDHLSKECCLFMPVTLFSILSSLSRRPP